MGERKVQQQPMPDPVFVRLELARRDLKLSIRILLVDAGADRDGIPRPSGSRGLPSGPRELELSSHTDRHHIVTGGGRNDQLGPRSHGCFFLAPPARPLVGRKNSLARYG